MGTETAEHDVLVETVENADTTGTARRNGDLAYARRVRVAVADVMRTHDVTEHDVARGHGFTEDRWEALARSGHQAQDKAEFAAFAAALEVTPRWLATGAWYDAPDQRPASLRD